MILRKSEERGRSNLGWLDSRHTFSFGDYFDPKHMSFKLLRVINEDRVAPGRGFGTHRHDNMEIISYVLRGALEHKDSLGTGSIIHANDVQRMSAGSGVAHSECNPSETEEVHFLQIWILPNMQNLLPSYEQKRFSMEEKRGRLALIASALGRDGSLRIHQDVEIYATVLDGDDSVDYAMKPERSAWVQVARGTVRLNGQQLQAGDGIALTNTRALQLDKAQDAEMVIFDIG
jgi:redox-sensitive bicupin YhaK (pirin superfamily)